MCKYADVQIEEGSPICTLVICTFANYPAEKNCNKKDFPPSFPQFVHNIQNQH